jgi:cation diffusion facilitator CzcD-associated flavoprotein CzcO
MASCETVIVGAGPYGLTIAAHLRVAQIPFQIFGNALESWRTFMPEGMVLKSEPFASNLWDPQRRFTLKRFAAEKKIPYVHSGRPLSLASFLDYAEWFRRRAVVEPNPAKVRRITHKHGEFTLEFAGQPAIKARRVILATGHMAFCYVPPELADLPKPMCLHTTQLGDVRSYDGRDVTVLGAGQSALESAALLHEAGARVRVIARVGNIIWNPAPSAQQRSVFATVREPESGLGLGWRAVAIAELPQLFRRLFAPEKRHRFVAGSWGPTGAWWLKERFEKKDDTLLGCRIRSASADGERIRLLLEGPGGTQEIATDQLIAGTGFKVDVDRMEILDPGLRASIQREGPMPQLTANFETSVPGLFVVGIASAPTFGPVMRFMFGAKHVGPVLARRLKLKEIDQPAQAVASLSRAAK